METSLGERKTELKAVLKRDELCQAIRIKDTLHSSASTTKP